MKTKVLALLLGFCYCHTTGQSNQVTGQMIEGGKVVVELIKAIQSKKETDKNPGCKGKYADLCIFNESTYSMTAILQHRANQEKREMIILPGMQECSLQIGVGVWTYDLRLTVTTQPIRKGDLLVEGCQNLMMNIRY
ncbi:MAG: hypothetical protein ABIQ11_07905 [Saprospiraceae bacterium]